MSKETSNEVKDFVSKPYLKDSAQISVGYIENNWKPIAKWSEIDHKQRASETFTEVGRSEEQRSEDRVSG